MRVRPSEQFELEVLRPGERDRRFKANRAAWDGDTIGRRILGGFDLRMQASRNAKGSFTGARAQDDRGVAGDVGLHTGSETKGPTQCMRTAARNPVMNS